MIDETADEKMPKQPAARHHFWQRQIDGGRLADALAGPAGDPGTDMAQDTEASRDVVQYLRDVLTDQGLGAATTASFRTMLHRDARDVRRDWRADAGFSGGARLWNRRDVIVGRDDNVARFEHQAELGDVHLLGTASEPGAEQLGKAMLQLLDRHKLDFDGLLRSISMASAISRSIF